MPFILGADGALMTTPNGMLMGMGGNWVQDQFSWKGGTAWGDIFMENIDHGHDPGEQLRATVESGVSRAPEQMATRRRADWIWTACCTMRRCIRGSGPTRATSACSGLPSPIPTASRKRPGWATGLHVIQSVLFAALAATVVSGCQLVGPDRVDIIATGIRRPDDRRQAAAVDRHTVRRGVPVVVLFTPDAGRLTLAPVSGTVELDQLTVGGPYDGLQVTEQLPDGFDWRTAEEVTLIVTAPEVQDRRRRRSARSSMVRPSTTRTRSISRASAGSIRNRLPSRTAGHC